MDRWRLPKAKRKLDNLFSSDKLRGILFLVLGNKINLPTAASEEELKYAQGPQDTFEIDVAVPPHGENCVGCQIEVFMCSVVRRVGYKEASFAWRTPYGT